MQHFPGPRRQFGLVPPAQQILRLLPSNIWTFLNWGCFESTVPSSMSIVPSSVHSSEQSSSVPTASSSLSWHCFDSSEQSFSVLSTSSCLSWHCFDSTAPFSTSVASSSFNSSESPQAIHQRPRAASPQWRPLRTPRKAPSTQLDIPAVPQLAQGRHGTPTDTAQDATDQTGPHRSSTSSWRQALARSCSKR